MFGESEFIGDTFIVIPPWRLWGITSFTSSEEIPLRNDFINVASDACFPILYAAELLRTRKDIDAMRPPNRDAAPHEL